MSYKDARYYEGRHYDAPYHGNVALVPFPPPPGTLPPPGVDFDALIASANQNFLTLLGKELTYTPTGSASFQVTAVIRTWQMDAGVYKVLEIDPADMPVVPKKNDEVEIDGVLCVVRGDPDLDHNYGLWRVDVRVK